MNLYSIFSILFLHFGKLQSSRWMLWTVGLHQCSAAQQNQNTQSHTIPTLTGPVNLIPLPLLTTPNYYITSAHTCTSRSQTYYTLGLPHPAYTRTLHSRLRTRTQRERRMHIEKNTINALVYEFYITRAHA